MASFYGISPVAAYQQNFTGTPHVDEQTNAHVNDPKYDDRIHEISSNKVGSASTKVARKGIKYVWNKCVTFLKNFFKKNEKIIEDSKNAYEVADNVQKVVTLYDAVTGDNTTPKYNYEA